MRRLAVIEPLEARIAPAATDFLSALNGSNGFTLTGGTQPAIVDHDYTLILNGGDVNGDGIDDLLVGSDTFEGTNALGEVAIIFGRAGGFPANLDLQSLGTNGVLITGQGGGFATSFSGVGDVNGDGFGDIIIGAPHAGVDADGEAYVVFGQATWPASQNISGLDGANGFKIAGDPRTFPGGIGVSLGGNIGAGNGNGGDFNGDGFSDVLIGAPDLEAFAQARAGGVFVVFGHTGAFPAVLSTAALNGTNGTLIASSKGGDAFGSSVGYAGDVNQDGRDDVAIGNPLSGAPAGFHTTIIFGQTTSPASINVVNLTAAQGFDIPSIAQRNGDIYFAGSKVLQRDIDGDGDLDLGAPFNFAIKEKVEGYVWAKNSGDGFSTNPFSTPTKLTRHMFLGLNGSNPYGNFGITDAFYDPGDFDGNGATDYLAYVPGSEVLAVYNGTLKGGTSYLNSSKASGVLFLNEQINLKNASQAGSFSFVGDINGDGLDDAAWIPPTGQVTQEAFVVLGTNLTVSKDNRTYTYIDVDGDAVTVKTTKGQLDPGMFTFASVTGAVVGGKQLQKLDLSLAKGVSGFDPTGANITITARRGPLGGDGLVNVGAIDATGINLGAVTVAGDLGQIDAGTGAANTTALSKLSVQSLGRLGFTTQPSATASLQSDIKGQLKKLSVTTDIDGATVSVLGQIGSVSVGHSLIGGTTESSGSIVAFNSIGKTSIGGNLYGGVGMTSGSISGFSIASVKVGGSLFGGGGQNSARIVAIDTIGPITIGHDVHGGTINSGGVLAAGPIASVKIGGNLFGGVGSLSGSISSLSSIGPVNIGGNLEAGTGAGPFGILAGGSLGAVKISGSIFGTADLPAFITSGTDPKSSTLKSVTVDGSVRFAKVLAGFDIQGDPIAPVDAQIGAVVVKGDWIGSSISAGVNAGVDQQFGTNDDRVSAGVSGKVFSKIKSITIGGEARGTEDTGDSFAFTAEQIGSFKVGKTKIALASTSSRNTAEDEFGVGPTFDLRVRELDAVTPLNPVVLAAVTGPARELSDDGKTFTFTDVDGDAVIVKTDKGKFSFGVFEFGTGTNQLQRINLGGGDFAGKKASLTITAERTELGGDGWVDIGAIDASGISLVNVTVGGDLGEIDATSTDAAVPALGKLTVHSLGGRANFVNFLSSINGALTKLSVATDVRDVTVQVFGEIRTISVLGSLIGDGPNESGSIHAIGAIGKATIGGDLRGAFGSLSGSLIADGLLGKVTVGNLRGGTGASSGSIRANAGSGAVDVKLSAFGGGGGESGSIAIREGDLASVTISGDLVGGTGLKSGAIIATGPDDRGMIGNVAIKGSVIATNNSSTGIFSSSTVGAISVTGDVRGVAGATVRIVAEGLTAPSSESKALALKSLTISGAASRVDVLAGYDTNVNALRADVQIGAIKVKGNWARGNVLAGVNFNGTAIPGGDADIGSRIASIIVSEGIIGAPGAVPGTEFLFAAQQIGSVKIGKVGFPFSSGTLQTLALGPTGDVRALEVG